MGADVRPLLRAITLLLWSLYPMIVYAASVTLEVQFRQVSLFVWAQVTILSLLSGLGTFLNWLKEGLEAADAKPTPEEASKARARLFNYLGVKFASHMMSSWLAGVFAFFATQGIEYIGAFGQAIAIGVAALGGSRYLTMLVERRTPKAEKNE